MPEAKKRPQKTNLQINMGLLSMVVDVFSPRITNATKATKLHMCCPQWAEHAEEPHGVKQRYVCEQTLDAEQGLWEPGELAGLKYQTVDKKNVIVTGDEVASIKEENKFESLEIRPHPHDDAHVLAAGNVYVVQPQVASQFYSTLLALVGPDGAIATESGPKMLVGEVTIKSGSNLFVRLENWNGQLVMRELVRPEEVDSWEPVDSTADTKQVDLARQLIEAQSEAFDPDEYKSRATAALKALLTERSETGEMPAETVVKPQKAAEDITALLEASLAAAGRS